MAQKVKVLLTTPGEVPVSVLAALSLPELPASVPGKEDDH